MIKETNTSAVLTTQEEHTIAEIYPFLRTIHYPVMNRNVLLLSIGAIINNINNVSNSHLVHMFSLNQVVSYFHVPPPAPPPRPTQPPLSLRTNPTFTGNLFHYVPQGFLGKETIATRQIRHPWREQSVSQEVRHATRQLTEQVPPSYLVVGRMRTSSELALKLTSRTREA